MGIRFTHVQKPTPRSHRATFATTHVFGLALMVALASAPLVSGCKLFSSTCDEGDRDCLSRESAPGVGSSCERTVQCRAGLTCVDKTCAAAATTANGDSCKLTAECESGLFCSSQRICEEAGMEARGGACEDSSDCVPGLVCGFGEYPLNRECVETGDGDLYARCSSAKDCMAGLSCIDTCRLGPDVPCVDETAGAHCNSLPISTEEVPPIPFWSGVQCQDEASEAVAYFEIPGSKPLDEFYRLPFPNDIRLINGKVDLSNHPRPPASSEFAVATKFIEAADGHLEGFGTTPVVLFRFSKPVLHGGDAEDLVKPTVTLVNVTVDSPDYGVRHSYVWTANDRSNYICDYALAIRVPPESPLRPGTTYAAIVTHDLQAEGRIDFQRSDDFSAMIKDSEPNESRLKTHYGKYAPLREFLTDSKANGNAQLTAGNLLTAAVFTTGRPQTLVRKLDSVIDERAAPTTGKVVLCDGSEPYDATADCDSQASCVGGTTSFNEYHGKIELPIFQNGRAPYLTDGGDIDLDGEGNPVVTRKEEVCFSLTVPSEAAENPPVVIYGHGTGGGFKSQLGGSKLAAALSKAEFPTAMLAIDLPQHSTRRGASTDSPDRLFFNIINPGAARGNVLQGSSDLLSLVRWIRAGSFPVPLTRSPIAIMGHSQGATHAALTIPFTPEVTTYVLSGVGGHLSTSLLHKTEPQPVADAMGALLLDIDGASLAAGPYNPALAIMQAYYEPADPLNFTRQVYSEPSEMTPEGHHFLMTFGIDDHFSPSRTQKAYAVAATLPHVSPNTLSLGRATIPAPVQGNVTVGNVVRTVGVRQYQAVGDKVDGHYVSTRPGQDGFGDVVRFLSESLAEQVPHIGE